MAPNTALLETAAALLRAAGGELQTTNLNKALFYTDLVALRDTGETVTGATYIALEHGPVVAKYPKKLIRDLEREGIARQLEGDNGTAKPVRLIRRSEPRLSREHMRIVEMVAKWASAKTATRVSLISHSNPGWEIAARDGVKAGMGAQPIDMHLALQEMGDDDPWLAEAADDSEFESLESAASREAVGARF